MRPILEQIVRWMIRRLVRLYYPKIEVTGRGGVPREGGVLLVANHCNSLLDPVMLGIASRRLVRFFAKAPLFDTPVFGAILRGTGMLPAYRGQDARSEVRKNLESLERGARALAAGEAVGIFPEGKSHDGLHLEQVRSGAARMAVQAVAAGARSLAIVPVGINYERKQRFRSAVWLRIGEPIDVVRAMELAGGDERTAVRMITAEIEKHLRSVVLHLDDPAYQPFLADLEVLLPPAAATEDEAIGALRQRKRIADAMNHFLAHQRGRAEEMAEAIRGYRAKLEGFGLTPHAPVIRLRRLKLFFSMLCQALWLTFWFPAAAIGAVVHVLPFLAVRSLARKSEDGPTTTALFRLLFGFPVFVLWYAGLWLAVRSYFLPWVAWTVVAALPMTGLLALSWVGRARYACDSWLAQWRVLLRPSRLAELRTEQAAVRQRLLGLAEDFNRAVPDIIPAQVRRRLPKTRRKRVLRWAVISALAIAAFVTQNSWLKHSSHRHRTAGLNVGGMSSRSLQVVLAADETALNDLLTGLEELEVRARATKAEFDAGNRSWYSQADDDAVRQLLLSYVNYRGALIRIIWKYQDYGEIRNEGQRLRAFLASYTAACALYHASLKMVTMFADAPEAIRKLNEPEPVWSIPAEVYDTARRNLVDTENLRLLASADRRYREWENQFTQHGLRSGKYGHFHATVSAQRDARRESVIAGIRSGLSVPLVDATKTGKDAMYEAQRFISSWVGDTKVRVPRDGASLISARQVTDLRRHLKPGDVLLERRNWFLSNAFLPGYWPHAALYVGTADDVARLGLDRDPRVQKHWKRFTARDEKGHEHVVLEAIGEGVVFTSLEHSAGEADAVAVLRPRLSQGQIKEAIARAFSHAGKPYDFEFDFFSSDKLVCSELVFRAYDGAIRFPLVDVFRRKTLPPIELVRQCARERGTAAAQFDVIAFLDGSERKGRAEFASEDAFYSTVNRPGLTLQQR